jgi:hypothetical protein
MSTYRHVVLNDSAMARAYVNNLSQEIISSAHVADRDLTAAVEDVQGTAHVGQPTVRDPIGGEDGDHSSPLGVPHVLLQPDAPNDAVNPEDDARVLLASATTSLRDVATNHDGLPHRTPVTQIRHTQSALNEYTDFRRICEGAFIWQFPLGCPYETIPTHAQLRHLFMQADNRASDDAEFAMYMWKYAGPRRCLRWRSPRLAIEPTIVSSNSRARRRSDHFRASRAGQSGYNN